VLLLFESMSDDRQTADCHFSVDASALGDHQACAHTRPVCVCVLVGGPLPTTLHPKMHALRARFKSDKKDDWFTSMSGRRKSKGCIVKRSSEIPVMLRLEKINTVENESG
jgi:hypothetical protein